MQPLFGRVRTVGEGGCEKGDGEVPKHHGESLKEMVTQAANLLKGSFTYRLKGLWQIHTRSIGVELDENIEIEFTTI